jgi:hypothetical protein
MGSAYTPGLKVSPMTTIRKIRRLPLKGTVTVAVGDSVKPETVVARADIPGMMQTVRVAETLGVEPNEIKAHLKIDVGDAVEREQLLADSRSFFGLFKSECRSPVAGVVELFSEHSGHLGIRQKPTPIEVMAYTEGVVAEVIPEEGVIVETRGAFIQGIFGVGGERTGAIKMLVDSPDQPLDESMIGTDCAGRIIVGGSNIDAAALRRAAEVGAAGVIVGAVVDSDLIDFLGYDIGVAITGQEDIGSSLIITEGFGNIRMADRTFKLLRSLDGRSASLNGATQIRAGVIRPELIVPSQSGVGDSEASQGQVLEIGANIRVIREPYFGILGKVTALPPEPVLVPSGSTVRVLKAALEDGRTAIVPRANVEIIEQ